MFSLRWLLLIGLEIFQKAIVDFVGDGFANLFPNDHYLTLTIREKQTKKDICTEGCLGGIFYL